MVVGAKPALAEVSAASGIGVVPVAKGWCCVVLAAVVAGWCAPALAQPAPVAVVVSYLGREEAARLPLSLVEPVLTDAGVKGAEQAVGDNATTGRFLKQSWRLAVHRVAADGDLAGTFKAATAAGERLFVADLKESDLKALAPLAEAAGALLFNARAEDDDLRLDGCSPALFHTAPSRAMKADALAQYLVWKRWPRWYLIVGSHPEDQALAAAYRRAATKFGAEIVAETVYEDKGGARRTDTGHVQVQNQIPVLTQGAAEHDVVLVADESDVFGEYLPYRTWEARPVVGTSGLVPVAWSRVHEQWGGTQMQRRFERFAGRPMVERDFNAWVAVRALGEAVTRVGSAEPDALHGYLVGGAFEVAAFKGQGVSFRHWDQQLRQPILLVTPRMLVSVSPQDQFLHQRTPLDTLGFDAPESRCQLNGEPAP